MVFRLRKKEETADDSRDAFQIVERVLLSLINGVSRLRIDQAKANLVSFMHEVKVRSG
jgi:hypothetical protein